MPLPSALTLLLHRALQPRLVCLLRLCGTEAWQADPETLHEVRIASRRVRAVLDLMDLRAYPDLKGPARHLRRLTKALGLTRELDVHVEALEGLKEEVTDPLHRASLEVLLEDLDHTRRKTRKIMARDLKKVKLKDLSALPECPTQLESSPGATTPEATLQGSAWICLEPLLLAVDQVIPQLLNQEEVSGLHKLRIRVKRLRYTLEILEPAFPEPLETTLQSLKTLQTTLGEHHDHAMLEAHLRKLHGGLTRRQRATLASGVLDLIDLICERRRAHYERFQTLGQRHRDECLYFRLKRALEAGPGIDG